MSWKDRTKLYLCPHQRLPVAVEETVKIKASWLNPFMQAYGPTRPLSCFFFSLGVVLHLYRKSTRIWAYNTCCRAYNTCKWVNRWFIIISCEHMINTFFVPEFFFLDAMFFNCAWQHFIEYKSFFFLFFFALYGWWFGSHLLLQTVTNNATSIQWPWKHAL